MLHIALLATIWITMNTASDITTLILEHLDNCLMCVILKHLNEMLK